MAQYRKELFMAVGKEPSYHRKKFLHQRSIPMQLGAFSVSLAAKDIKASVAFYEMPGFTHHVGDLSQNWHVMKNGDAVIGLFHGMFEKNSLTFNPGWNQDAQAAPPFTDVCELQQQLKETGMEFLAEADPDTTGPASFVVVGPDGTR